MKKLFLKDEQQQNLLVCRRIESNRIEINNVSINVFLLHGQRRRENSVHLKVF